MKTIEFYLTPAAGKQLIAKAISARADMKTALEAHTVVVVAGTTNSYVAKLLLESIGETTFDQRGFYRGINCPGKWVREVQSTDEDVVIQKGKWQQGMTIYDVSESLGSDDIILKGANAVDLKTGQAGVMIGNRTSGTMAPISAAVMGRRTLLITPVGVEKRVEEPIPYLAQICNRPGAAGFRLYPSPGEVVTELDALRQLTGVVPHLLTGGGVCGYEGGNYFVCEGSQEQLNASMTLINTVRNEGLYFT